LKDIQQKHLPADDLAAPYHGTGCEKLNVFSARRARLSTAAQCVR